MSTWKAELTTVFEAPNPGHTILRHRQSVGPLALQKILYPEGLGIAHGFLLHPPSGIAGGDTISISSRVKPNAHALLTTPGAARWYKSNGQLSIQRLHVVVEDHACLEWLPSENIFFDHADAQMATTIHLAPTARFVGWELMQFGQRQSLESLAHPWHQARVRADTEIIIAGGLDWQESAQFSSENVLIDPAVHGTAGFSVSGTLWAYCSDPLSEVDKEAWPQQTDFSTEIRAGLTQLPSGLVVFRVLAVEAEIARQALIRAWSLLRPWAAGRQATPLRIWAT
jgi:urease accessory protein